MKLISRFWDPNNPAFNLRITAAALVTLGIVIMLAALGFAYQVSAMGNTIDCVLPTGHASTEPFPTVTEPTAATEPVQPETETPSGEVAAVQEALTAAEAERDALRSQLADTTASADRLQAELDALRLEQETVYTLVFHLERNATFPYGTEVITLTRTVDREIYELWEPGDIIGDHDSFLTLPDDGFFHAWTVSLADKYITGGAA